MNPAITNVHIASRADGRVSLCCDLNGAEYHVWVQVPGDIPEGVVYKNTTHPGQSWKESRTIKLRAGSRPMQALIGAMMDVYRKDGLLKKFQRQEASEKAKRLQNARIAMAAERKRAHGEELYSMLNDLVTACLAGSQDLQLRICRQAMRLMREINRKEAT